MVLTITPNSNLGYCISRRFVEQRFQDVASLVAIRSDLFNFMPRFPLEVLFTKQQQRIKRSEKNKRLNFRIKRRL